MQVWGIQHLHRCGEQVNDWVTWALYESEDDAIATLTGLAKDFLLGEPYPHKAYGGWMADAADSTIQIRAVPLDVVVAHDKSDRDGS